MQRGGLRSSDGIDMLLQLVPDGSFLQRRGDTLVGTPISVGSGTGGALPFRNGGATDFGPNGAALYDSYGTWINNANYIAIDFTNPATWGEIENPAYQLNAWKSLLPTHPGLTLCLGLSMFRTADYGNWAAAVAGTYDFHFTAFANSIVASGIKNFIIRIQWEFNLDAALPTANFAAYWIRIVNAIRAVTTGVSGLKVEFCYNPNFGKAIDLDAAYPGDAYVDYVGIDCYDFFGSSYVNGVQPSPANWATAWTGYLTGNGTPYGLNWTAAFCVTHGKKLCAPEWGLYTIDPSYPAGGDNTLYIQNMYDWFVANNCDFACLYELPNQHQLWPGGSGTYVTPFPNARALYHDLVASNSGGVGGGVGNVNGPSSASDSHLALWSGPTGQLLKDSSPIVVNGGAMSGVTSINATAVGIFKNVVSYLSADQTAIGTGLTAVTGFPIALTVGTFVVDMNGWYWSSAAGSGFGMGVDFSGSASVSAAIWIEDVTPPGQPFETTGFATRIGSNTSAPTSQATRLPFRFHALVTVTVAGNLTVEASAATGTTNIQKNSFARINQIA